MICVGPSETCIFSSTWHAKDLPTTVLSEKTGSNQVWEMLQQSKGNPGNWMIMTDMALCGCSPKHLTPVLMQNWGRTRTKIPFAYSPLWLILHPLSLQWPVPTTPRFALIGLFAWRLNCSLCVKLYWFFSELPHNIIAHLKD